MSIIVALLLLGIGVWLLWRGYLRWAMHSEDALTRASDVAVYRSELERLIEKNAASDDISLASMRLSEAYWQLRVQETRTWGPEQMMVGVACIIAAIVAFIFF